MNISATFIRKPIATSLLMAAILLLGLISYELLPVAALPNIDTPTVLVTAQFPGADAQTVAGTVTTPLERQFGQIPGLTQMTSSSGNESSEITLQFARSVSVETSSRCWVETTTASIRLGFPPTYSTLTCDFPSGRRKSSVPARRASESRRTSLCAKVMGMGISSAVSSQAYPNIMP